MRESPRPRKKVTPMFANRSPARKDAYTASQFIEDAQLAVVFSSFELLALLCAHNVGLELPAWITHPLCLSVFVSFTAFYAAMGMKYFPRKLRSARLAYETASLRKATYESASLAAEYKHDA